MINQIVKMKMGIYHRVLLKFDTLDYVQILLIFFRGTIRELVNVNDINSIGLVDG